MMPAREHDRIARQIAGSTDLHEGDVIDALRRNYKHFEENPVQCVERASEEISKRVALSKQDIMDIILDDYNSVSHIDVVDSSARFVDEDEDYMGVGDFGN